jgi:hypothetical protein
MIAHHELSIHTIGHLRIFSGVRAPIRIPRVQGLVWWNEKATQEEEEEEV